MYKWFTAIMPLFVAASITLHSSEGSRSINKPLPAKVSSTAESKWVKFNENNTKIYFILLDHAYTFKTNNGWWQITWKIINKSDNNYVIYISNVDARDNSSQLVSANRYNSNGDRIGGGDPTDAPWQRIVPDSVGATLVAIINELEKPRVAPSAPITPQRDTTRDI